MKRFAFLLLSLMLIPMGLAAKEGQNIMVWGSVDKAADGKYYMTLYKNSPARVTAEFHFDYKDRSESLHYSLEMPDSVASVLDPVPVDKPVKAVVIDKVIYEAVKDDGTAYRTEDPDDPVLAMLLEDLFDFYHDIYWLDAMHRSSYYNRTSRIDRWKPSRNKSKPKADDLDLSKLDDSALIVGAAAVAAASVGMALAVSRQWNVPDDRFPYFSMSPQIQYFAETGNMRDVLQLKYRIGRHGGMSLLTDLGWSSGSRNVENCFDPGFTWSVGIGLDLGAFSLSLRTKPASGRYTENFFSCQATYDFFITRDFALDLSAGAAVIEHDDNHYLDIPLSLGLLWKF
ncbi:MAG: hypothetical protein MJY66_07350 [Bacteroidaceae bacterium]|nr:hypothetical protein [Bacteroidaceae bacterium]